MIVTKNTTQGDFAEKFNLGVVVDDCSNLDENLRLFLKEDYSSYVERCNKLLELFLSDQVKFEKTVKEFVTGK